MSSRSAMGKSATCSKNLAGSGSPKNTMSGFTTPVQTEQWGTLSAITSVWGIRGQEPRKVTLKRGKDKSFSRKF